MRPLSAAFAITLVALLVVSSGCGPNSPAKGDAPPAGYPRVFGWDGVTNRVVMADIVHKTPTPPGVAVDPSTWVFDGSRWSKALPEESMPSIEGRQPALVYDSVRNREVLILASGSGMPRDADTTQVWEWDGRSWQQKTTRHSLAAHNTQWLTAAYSPELRAVVLIDTHVEQGEGPATWLYDGTDWRSIVTRRWPLSLGGNLVASYDPTRHVIVGLSSSDFTTWEFDGSDWVQTYTSGGSGPLVDSGMGRQSPAVTFDTSGRGWIVFGGSDGSDDFGDTWTGGRTLWQLQSPASPPASRNAAAMAWDPAHNRALMFGGIAGWPQQMDLGDTWAWDGATWRQLAGPTYARPSPTAS